MLLVSSGKNRKPKGNTMNAIDYAVIVALWAILGATGLQVTSWLDRKEGKA